MEGNGRKKIAKEKKEMKEILPKHTEALPRDISKQMNIHVHFKIVQIICEELVLGTREDRFHVVFRHEATKSKSQFEIWCVEHVDHRLCE